MARRVCLGPSEGGAGEARAVSVPISLVSSDGGGTAAAVSPEKEDWRARRLTWMVTTPCSMKYIWWPTMPCLQIS